MPILRSLLSSVFVLLILAGPTAFAQGWSEVRSPNLPMVTADVKSGQAALWHLEQVRTEFGHLLNRKKVNRNRPILIFGMRNEADVKQLVGTKPLFPGGYAISARDRNYLVMDLSANDWSGIYRAYALLLLDANYPRTQPWFDEGLAQYLAGLNATERQAELRPPPEVSQMLASSGGLLPISQLISPDVQQSSPPFRATAWLLFRWLVESNQLEAAAQYFGQVMLQRIPPEQAFTQSFSISPADLDAALAKFRTTAVAPKRIEVPVELDKGKFVSNKITDTTSRALWLQFRMELNDERKQAVADLLQLLSKDHDNLEVNRGLGLANLREGDLKSAADHIRRAIELQDNSAEMHYLLALYYNQGSPGPIQMDSAGPSVLLQADKAITLDPEFSDAYEVMAQAQIAVGHPDQASKTIRLGMALRPRDEGLMLAFATVQMANGKYSEARDLLTFLKGSSDRVVAQRAAEMLVTATNQRRNEQKWAEQGYRDPTSPKWKPTKPADGEVAAMKDEESKEEPKPDTRKVEYLKGTLLSVECSDAKSATLKVSSTQKTWTFVVPDRSSAVLIGVDDFQCSWRNIPVSVNYRASGQQQGDLVSLEIDR